MSTTNTSRSTVQINDREVTVLKSNNDESILKVYNDFTLKFSVITHFSKVSSNFEQFFHSLSHPSSVYLSQFPHSLYFLLAFRIFSPFSNASSCYPVPICMPADDSDFTGRVATVTGWGRLEYNGVVPAILQEVQVNISSKTSNALQCEV